MDLTKSFFFVVTLSYPLLAHRQKCTKSVPNRKKVSFRELGTADSDALRLEGRRMFNTDNLLAKAVVARVAREAAGISDSVEAIQPRIYAACL